MERFRGIEAGYTHAEAYARQDQSPIVDLTAICAPAQRVDSKKPAQ
jgi:hypothetical protein